MKPNIMNQSTDYCCELLLHVSPAAVLERICDVASWWSVNLGGLTRRQDDTFHVRFGKTWADIRITALMEGERMIWEVTDCYLDLLKDPQEWKHTRIHWELRSQGEMTVLSMRHEGLVPGLECFEDCNKGWDFFIRSSLYELITTGKGHPATGIHAYVVIEDEIFKGTLYYKRDPLPEIIPGQVIIDVKQNAAERVIEAYSVCAFDPQAFDPAELQGENYMVLEQQEGLKISSIRLML